MDGVWTKALKLHIIETPNGDVTFNVYSNYNNYGDAYTSNLKIKMTGLGVLATRSKFLVWTNKNSENLDNS